MCPQPSGALFTRAKLLGARSVAVLNHVRRRSFENCPHLGGGYHRLVGLSRLRHDADLVGLVVLGVSLVLGVGKNLRFVYLRRLKLPVVLEIVHVRMPELSPPRLGRHRARDEDHAV